MNLDLLVPIKAAQKFLSKYGKAILGFAGIMLVFGAFVMGYRYGSSIGIQGIVFSSTNGILGGFASNNNSTLQNGNVESESHVSGADTTSVVKGLGVEDVDEVRESDPSHIIAELEEFGFDEEIRIPSESVISVPYGWRKDPITEDWRYSSGIRFASNSGDSVYTSMSGVVISVEQKMSGYEVTVLHPFRVTTHYCNLESIVARVGERVAQGELLGYASDVARPSGGVYFEVRQFGEVVDPRSMSVNSQ